MFTSPFQIPQVIWGISSWLQSWLWLSNLQKSRHIFPHVFINTLHSLYSAEFKLKCCLLCVYIKQKIYIEQHWLQYLFLCLTNMYDDKREKYHGGNPAEAFNCSSEIWTTPSIHHRDPVGGYQLAYRALWHTTSSTLHPKHSLSSFLLWFSLPLTRRWLHLDLVQLMFLY